MTTEEMNLKDYVEGRFDRLTTSIDEKMDRQQEEFRLIISSNDLRYQQRFEAQGKELDKAFSAAKEAVNAALTAADKASLKTEQTADKRFADLGDLIREQFKGFGDKFDSVTHRVEVVEGRLNMSSGEITGQKQVKEDQKSLWALIVSVGVALLVLWNSIKG